VEVITERARAAHAPPPLWHVGTWATPLDSVLADLCGDGVVFVGEARCRIEGGDGVCSSFRWSPVAL